MFKRAILISTILAITICYVPFSVAASSDVPIILTPIQYEEVKPNYELTISWQAPTSGTVVKYLISLREFCSEGVTTDELLLDRYEATPSVRNITLTNMIKDNGNYRLSVCAVLSNGTYKYSDEIYFYSGTAKGIVSTATISFKIWTGFTTETKNAIYYSTRTWINALGVEKVNTYPYDQGVTSSTYYPDDGTSAITPVYLPGSDYTMVTHLTTVNDYVVEADILINKERPWSNNLTAGTFDIQNIMTHELGHVYGLSDKYQDHAREWTMYGAEYDYCLTYKRSLHSSDLLSYRQLYDLA